MKHAAIVGWGKCMPPAILSNADLATFLDTSDEWILTRTGIRERRISHVPLAELIHVAAARALACAGIEGRQIELIVVGTTSYDDQCPNVASGLQRRIGADGCAANNGSKSNPCLCADILGDWREELVARSQDGLELRIYTTTIPTEFRLPTLMHDPVYRLGVAWQNVSYNQPAHTSFDMSRAVRPSQ